MRRSFSYLLIGVPALAILVAGALAILLPQVVAARLAERAMERHGLTMTAEGGAGFSFTDRLEVTLDTVTFTRGAQQGVPLASVGQIRIENPVAAAFTGGLRHIRLIDPVFTFTAAETKNPADGSAAGAGGLKARALDIAIENGAIKASDPQRNLAIAITDISGTVTQREDGALDAALRGLFNGVATELSLAVDDMRRLEERGSPSDVSLSSKAGQIVMSGRLRFAGTLAFDGSVSAEAGDAQSFISWLGVPLAGLSVGVPLGIDGGLSIADAGARFRNLALALGDMQAKGEVSIEAQSPRPKVTADLAFNSINLNAYSRSGPGGPAPAPDLTRDWREEPLPFQDLKSADADFTLTTDSLVAGAVTAGASRLTVALKDGTLQAKLATQAVSGGKADVDLTLEHGAANRMALVMDVAGVAAQDFLGKAFGLRFLAGLLDLKTDLSATGSSPAQLISTLKGTADIRLSEGRIDGVDLARLAGLVADDDVEGWGLSADAATAFSAAQASASFADGIATLAGTRVEAAGFVAKTEGSVDLLRRAVDLTVTPGKGLPLPVAARIRGPWEKPKLSAKLDLDGALRGGVDGSLEDTAKSAKKALKKLLGD